MSSGGSRKVQRGDEIAHMYRGAMLEGGKAKSLPSAKALAKLTQMGEEQKDQGWRERLLRVLELLRREEYP